MIIFKKHHDKVLSHETIYRCVYEDKARHEELKPFLRQGKKLGRKRHGSGARTSKTLIEPVFLIAQRLLIRKPGLVIGSVTVSSGLIEKVF